MKLTERGLQNKSEWERLGIALPQFQVGAMKAETNKNPEWIHIGAGNIFRGLIGSVAQNLLNSGAMKSGIIAVESFDFEIIDRIYRPYDNLTLYVRLGKDSSVCAEVLAGIAESLKTSDEARLLELAAQPSLGLISLTITEKGYAVKDADGALLPIVARDIQDGTALHTMSLVTTMLYHRYRTCGAPLAVLSLDNCSRNGEKLRDAIVCVANGWAENGTVSQGFLDYLQTKVSFPWSMIDQITPRPDESVQTMLQAWGIEGMDCTVTKKGTYIAPFVNAEIPHYLVIEDDFPNGRPPFDCAGVYMTDRKTVQQTETMKVTTCLNPLHTALAVFGCLLGYTSIWEEMLDMDLVRLVQCVAEEGMKVVSPSILDPKQFLREVLAERLPNPHIPDTPQRIATDTSQKIAVRFGETIKAYTRSTTLDASTLRAIPMVIAGWLRYLCGTDDAGGTLIPSPDPMLEDLQNVVAGAWNTERERLHELLSNTQVFGLDLGEAGLSETIEDLFFRMCAGRGAVRDVLKSLAGE